MLRKRSVLLQPGLILLTVAASLASGSALAQTAPNAGQLLNEQQQQKLQLPQRLQQDQDDTALPEMTDKGGTRVVVRSFHFNGTDGITSDSELQKVVAKSIGKKLNFSQLQAVAEAVTAYLKQKGWPLAQAYLPRQDVTDGKIEITILQGRVEKNGATVVAKDTRMSKEMLKGMVDSALPVNGSPSNEDLERGVLLINDMPGMSAHTTLERGSQKGSSRVMVDATEGPMVTGSLSGDNYGNRYTGHYEVNPTLNLNDPLGWGDQFTVSGNESTTAGLLLANLGYNVPIGTSGLRAGVTYSHLWYSIDSRLLGVDANGTASVTGASLSYPIIRTRALSLWSGASYTYKSLMDEVGGVKISDRSLNDAGVSLSLSNTDDWFGGGMNSVLLGATLGDLDRSRVLTDITVDSATARSNGTFGKVTGSVARLQHITDDFSFFGAARGQLASKNLDSSEKFILGGPAGVRAFPVGEASGDQGWLTNLELRYDVPAELPVGHLQLVTFTDMGGVFLNQDPWTGAVNTATGKNDYMLAGVGLGANLTMADRFSLRASWSIAVSDNPGRSLTGHNADGLNRDNAFWLQGVVGF